MSKRKRQLHLVGSVPLKSTEDVFTTCAGILGDRVERFPDGETGERWDWIGWQHKVLGQVAGVELADTAEAMHPYRIRADAAALRFGSLGYAEAALQSWERFKEFRAQGIIKAAQRFQVSLPTPLAVVTRYIQPEMQKLTEPPYEEAMMRELRQILDAIPPRDLAIQWDVAMEFAILEGLLTVPFAPVFEGITDRLLRLAAAVPEPVQLGFHLCYGDQSHKHFIEPKDTGLLVQVADSIIGGLSRQLHWIHMPVPRDRFDAAYFKPLTRLRLPMGCRLFLGLVHMSDGVEGANRRIAAAKPYAPGDFGIATECGMGRRDPATIPDLLQLHIDI